MGLEREEATLAELVFVVVSTLMCWLVRSSSDLSTITCITMNVDGVFNGREIEAEP